MSEWNLAAKPQEERDKINVTMPKPSDARYIEMAEANKK